MGSGVGFWSACTSCITALLADLEANKRAGGVLAAEACLNCSNAASKAVKQQVKT